MSYRSPVYLRSQNTTQPSNTVKSVSKLSTKTQKSAPKNAPIKQKKETIKTPSIAEQLAEIKELFASQSKQFDDSIQSIRNDVHAKFTFLFSTIASIASDLGKSKAHQIKRQPTIIYHNEQTNAIQPYWYDKTANETIDYLLRGSYIHSIDKVYKSQIDELSEKVESLEKSLNDKVRETSEAIADDECECEYGLFDVFICKIHHKNAEQVDNLSATMKNNVDINNIIDCLQEQIDQVSQSIRTNDEKVLEASQQLRELSSKYTELKTNENKRINIFSFANCVSGRFIGKYDTRSNSQTLRVRVDFAEIHDLKRFHVDFKKKFERSTGKGSIKCVNILRYKVNDGTIFQLEVNITFNSPTSYDYLNNLRFPSNWIFLDNSTRRMTKFKAKQTHMT